MLYGVKGRSNILIHPANCALKELKGCIAPVTDHTSPGNGILSRVAMGQLLKLYHTSHEKKKPVYLTIRS